MRKQIANIILGVVCAAVVLGWFSAPALLAQTAEPDNPLRVNSDAGNDLISKQARLAGRYDQLELLAGRLAELTSATQPRRAKLLRQLVAKSRERDIAGQFDAVIDNLEVESLGKASAKQGELQVELQKLLDVLLQEDRDKQIESERKRIRKYLAELKRLIQLQRGIKARTDGGDETKPLTDDQQKLSDSTGKLQQEIEASEGTQAKESSDEDGKSSEPGQSESKDGEPSDKDGNNQQSPDGDTKDGDAPEKSPAEKSDSDGDSEPKQNSEKSPSDESKPDGKPNADNESNSDSKPNDSQPSDSKPSDGQPQDGQPQDGQPSPDGKPSDSPPSPGQGQGQSESSPGDSEPSESPAERAQQRLQKAQQRMQEALERLEEANRDEAVDQQEQALRELEQAKAELERILRQLREEELERMLVLLEARFRKMLDAQVIVYEQTKKLDASESSVPEHEIEIASGRLSRQEREIVREADRALVLLREDGTTVAFPEAIEQARDDMKSVERRLGEVKISVITQGLEEDIIAALEETLAALQQALKQARAQKGQPQQPSSGSPEDKALVDQLAELRMIRALQNRINRRTKRYGDIIGDQPTADPDLREALDELSLRQESIFRATRDLDSGRNK